MNKKTQPSNNTEVDNRRIKFLSFHSPLFTKAMSGLAIILLAILLAGLALYMLGRLEVVFKNSNQVVRVESAPICDQEVIDEFNVATETFSDSRFEEVYDTVVEKDGYSNDVNCIYVTLRHYLISGDVENAETALERYISLNDNGYHPSDQLFLTTNREEIRAELEVVRMRDAGETAEPEEGSPQEAVTGEG